jgi:tRNA threonylcarbamoyl adenosine modification protein YeaZ
MYSFLIDTSSSYLLLAAVNDSEVLFSSVNKFIARANEALLTLIDQCLKNNNILLDEIDEFFVIVGPGSYTGIRIGIATMLAFSIAYGKPLVGLTLLDAFVLSLNREKLAVFYKLGENRFVTKKYDFKCRSFTDCEIVESPELYENESFVINNNLYNPALTLLNKNLIHFKRDYTPIYLGNNFYDNIKKFNI